MGDLERLRHALTSRSDVLLSMGRHREGIVVRQGLLAVALGEDDLRTAAHALLGLAMDGR